MSDQTKQPLTEDQKKILESIPVMHQPSDLAALKARADKAEAACAQMASILNDVDHLLCESALPPHDKHHRSDICPKCRWERIETDSGKGWMAPEDATAIIGTIQKLQPAGSPMPTDALGTVQWIVQTVLDTWLSPDRAAELEAENQRLREALEKIGCCCDTHSAEHADWCPKRIADQALATKEQA